MRCKLREERIPLRKVSVGVATSDTGMIGVGDKGTKEESLGIAIVPI